MFGRGKINAWRARPPRAGFRKFSPCMARARRARGFDSLPSLALCSERKQKYQNGNIHRKLTVSTSVILP
jgi:hypothetical protein